MEMPQWISFAFFFWLCWLGSNDALVSRHPLSRRGEQLPSPVDSFKPFPKRFLYRGDSRSPEEIIASGGFQPVEDGYENDDEAFNINHHMVGHPESGSEDELSDGSTSTTSSNTWRTAFVSTSYAAEHSKEYGESGWIYVIDPTPNIIDVNSVNTEEYNVDKECVALGGIPVSQVVGWIKTDQYIKLRYPLAGNEAIEGQESQKPLDIMDHIERNEGIYTPERYSRVDLTNSPMQDFQSAAEAVEFMDKVGHVVGWTGKFPLSFPVPGTKEEEACAPSATDCPQDRKSRSTTQNSDGEPPSKMHKPDEEDANTTTGEEAQRTAEAQKTAQAKAVNSVQKLSENTEGGSWLGTAFGLAAATIGTLGAAAFATKLVVDGAIGGTAGAAGAGAGIGAGVGAGAVAASETLPILAAEEAVAVSTAEVAAVVAEVDEAMATRILLEAVPSPPAAMLDAGGAAEGVAEAMGGPLIGRRHVLYPRDADLKWALDSVGPALERALKVAFEQALVEAEKTMGL
ncbi:putative heat-labile enterotoxin [Ophiocordyceps camponoti-saundersi (nom. inval.)]|nr:putative heat-labile enterotoxin [Ophiocordyceps camponoti-saundersi (nom. inval.)]